MILAASAGGIEAIGTILESLPASFPTPIAVLQHRRATVPSLLEKILGRRSRLPVKSAEAGQRLVPGTVYVAPATGHLVVAPDHRFWLQDGKKVRDRSDAGPASHA